MIELLRAQLPEEGVRPNVMEKVDLFRIDRSSPRSPLSYRPSIIILAQGRKRVFIGDEVITYDPLNYLVLSVPLPLECETAASAQEPMLGLTVQVDAAAVGEILLAMEGTVKDPKFTPKGMYSAPLDDPLVGAVIRLLETLSSPSEKRVLGPMIVREIIYRVLCGEKGDALRALAFRNQRFFQIALTLDRIHDSYGDKLDLNTLAREAGMSISAFHTSFKAVTNTSPLQYIKSVRLHKARMLMIEEGDNAYNAAYRVGYESPSQFNREYKRLFGQTPAKDAIRSRVS
ncbi:MAG: AraC family transcriptional regulator N-terminal domain-containing protein [Mangrovibacterium sp.]